MDVLPVLSVSDRVSFFKFLPLLLFSIVLLCSLHRRRGRNCGV